MTEWTLGLDQGREGAAVLLHGDRRVVAGLHWWPHVHGGRRCYTLRAVSLVPGVEPGRWERLPGGWALGLQVQAYLQQWAMLAGNRVQIASEDVHIMRGPKANPKTAISLAKFAGALVSHVERWDPSGEATWVHPGQWRAALLGLPISTPTDAAKALALKQLPLRIDGLKELLAELGPQNDHVADAAGVAQWRAVQRAPPAEALTCWQAGVGRTGRRPLAGGADET